MAIRTAPAPSGGDDQAALVALFASAVSGDTIQFTGGTTYRHSGKITLTGAADSGITITATGAAGTPGVTLIATNSSQASLSIRDGANNCNISRITHKVEGATNRIDLANDVAPFVFNNVSGTIISDLWAEGSAGLGFFFYRATGGSVARITSKTTKADGIHFTNGSGGFTATDLYSQDAGDDGIAHIGYLGDGEAGRPQNLILQNPTVIDARARGISYAGAKDCSATNINVDGSLAANIYFAAERGTFNTSSTTNCKIDGGRLARAGTSYAAIVGGTDGKGLDQGAVLWLASGSGADVSGCGVNNVNIGNLAAVNYDTMRAISYGGAFSGNYATNINLYQGSPNTVVGGTTPSAISPLSFNNLRTTALPAAGAAPVTPPVTPPSVRPALPTGLVTLLRADTLSAVSNGGKVLSWSDTVGTRVYSQAAATAPTKVNVGLNNQPAIAFDGTQQLRMDGPPELAQPHSLFVIARPTNVTGSRQLLWQGSGGEVIIRDGKLNLFAGADAASDAAVTINNGFVLGGNFTGSDTTVVVNGVAKNVNAGTGAMNQGIALIGTNLGQPTWNFMGEIYEIRMYNRALNVDDRKALNSYAQDRYGIVTADYVAPSEINAPTAPSSLAATATSSSITLNWTASSDDTGIDRYEIFSSGALVGSTTSTTFTHSGLNPATAYSYTVRAFDPSGNFASSAVVNRSTSTPTRPTMPTGLVGHFRADSLNAFADGAAVTTWSDLVGTRVLTKTAATAPIKVNTAGAKSQPCVRFNGTSQDLRMTNPPALAQPFTMVVIATTTVTTGDRQLVWQGNGGESSIYQGKWFNYSGVGSTVNVPAPVANAPTVITDVFDGAGSAQYISGTLGVQANAGSAGMDGTLLTVGNHGTVTRFWSGDIYEIRIYNKVLTADDRKAVHSYAQDRYGITVSDYVAEAPAIKPRQVKINGVWTSVNGKRRTGGAWVSAFKIRIGGSWLE